MDRAAMGGQPTKHEKISISPKLSLDDLITKCLLCQERLREPKYLACHHSFCLQCIEGSAENGRVTCPLADCIKITRLPEGGATELEADKLREHLMEKYEESVVQKEINCHLCSVEVAKFCCIECELVFCQVCKAKHEEKIPAEDETLHAILALTEGLICPSHQHVAKRYCLDCGEYLCKICLHVHASNKNAKQHVFFNLHEYDAHWRELDSKLPILSDVIKSVNKRKEDIEKRNEMFENYAVKYKAFNESACDSIERLVGDLVNQIQRLKDTSILAINEIVPSDESAVETETPDELEDHSASLQQNRDSLRMALKGKPSELFQQVNAFNKEGIVEFVPKGLLVQHDAKVADDDARTKMRPIVQDLMDDITSLVPSLLRNEISSRLNIHFPSYPNLDAKCSSFNSYRAGASTLNAPATLTSYAYNNCPHQGSRNLKEYF